MEKRKKASDIFNETEFVFGRKIAFKDAFPEIEDITLQVIEDKPAWKKHPSGPFEKAMGTDHRYPKKGQFTKINFPGEFVDCTNEKCYNGGFNIGSILREMVSNHKTEKNGEAVCQGYEGSPKGLRKYGKCEHKFKYTINIRYK